MDSSQHSQQQHRGLGEEGRCCQCAGAERGSGASRNARGSAAQELRGEAPRRGRAGAQARSRGAYGALHASLWRAAERTVQMPRQATPAPRSAQQMEGCAARPCDPCPHLGRRRRRPPPRTGRRRTEICAPCPAPCARPAGPAHDARAGQRYTFCPDLARQLKRRYAVSFEGVDRRF